LLHDAERLQLYQDVVVDEFGRAVEQMAEHDAEVVSHMLAMPQPYCEECGQRSVLIALSVTDPDDPWHHSE